MVWMMIGGHSGAATARKLVFNGPGGRAGGLVTLVGISLILAIPLGWVGVGVFIVGKWRDWGER
jgi:hypothetical protein